MASIAVFDINETMLDLAPVRMVVDDVIGRPGAFTTWFGRLLQTSMAITTTGRYEDFGLLAATALDSVAQSEQVTLAHDAWDRVKAAMGSLRAHSDVEDGLARLHDQGWRLVALTNSGQATVDAQLRGAGIHDRFEAVLSVETAGAFKPSAAAYGVAIDHLGVAQDELVMVAAHDWDLAGAKAVGMSTAFIARPGMPFATVYPSADHVVTDFVELADESAEPTEQHAVNEPVPGRGADPGRETGADA